MMREEPPVASRDHCASAVARHTTVERGRGHAILASMATEEGSSPDPAGTELKWHTPRIRSRVLLTTLLLATICYSFFHWVLWPVKVVGDSMLPNFQNGRRYFINKLAYSSARPHRGDVIALRRPDGDIYIKRIVGLPGEHLDFEDGYVFINGKYFEEPYVSGPIPWQMHRWDVGPGEYFVIGDNRATSVFGTVAASDIIGRVVF